MDKLSEIKQLLKSTDSSRIAEGIELSKELSAAQSILQLYQSIWNMTYACSSEPEFTDIIKGPLSEKIVVLNEQDDLVPENLCAMEEVEKLDLGGFPEARNWQELVHYKNLKRLDFWENNLKSLPDAVYTLQTLEIMYVCDELETISSAIKQLQSLKSLQLEGNLLKNLPDEIGELKQLEELILAGNNLQNLPATITQLKQLKILDVSGNPELQVSDDLKAWLKENKVEFYI